MGNQKLVGFLKTAKKSRTFKEIHSARSQYSQKFVQKKTNITSIAHVMYNFMCSWLSPAKLCVLLGL